MQSKTLDIYFSPEVSAYEKFKAIDFIEDELFRLWVNEPNNSAINKFWENWFATVPANIAAAEEAREVLLTINARAEERETLLTIRNSYDDQVKHKQGEVWSKIKDSIFHDT